MEFTASSGAAIVINAAPFGSAIALKNALGKALSKSDVDFQYNPKKAWNQQDIDVGSVIKIAASLDSDELVNKALFDCLVRSTYNGQKIIRDTFEPDDARQDYYEVVLLCMKENLQPFFKGLVSIYANMKNQAAAPNLSSDQK